MTRMIGARAGLYRTQQFWGGAYGAYRTDFRDVIAGVDGAFLHWPDGPYQVRPWRPGDRMRPVRLRGRSRKLSDLFTDARVPRATRSDARVVERASDGTIVWAEHIGPAFGAKIHVTLTHPEPMATNKSR